MNLSAIPPFTVKLPPLSFHVSFSVDTLPILADKGLREVITCHIAQFSPIAFYTGDCVKHPGDPVSDDYYPFAKVAMKLAVQALAATLYDKGICSDCLFKAVYSEFRYVLRNERFKALRERCEKSGCAPVQVYYQADSGSPLIPLENTP